MTLSKTWNCGLAARTVQPRAVTANATSSRNLKPQRGAPPRAHPRGTPKSRRYAFSGASAAQGPADARTGRPDVGAPSDEGSVTSADPESLCASDVASTGIAG